MANRREIVLINRDEGAPASLLDKIEKLTKILTAVTLPLIVGIGGWWIQDALSQRDVNKDYVELAISILSKRPEETQDELREWATSLLDQTSPVALPDGLRSQLDGGEIRLPETSSSRNVAPTSEIDNGGSIIGLLSSVAHLDARFGDEIYRCTAWLVSVRHVVTAGNCAEIFGRELEVGRITFGSKGLSSLDRARSGSVELPVLETSIELDYAILSIDVFPVWSRFPLPIDTTPPEVGDRLLVLHPSQTGSGVGYIPQPCIVLTVEESTITHDCLTGRSSSGAPLINADTQKVIAIQRSAIARHEGAVRIDAILSRSKFLNDLVADNP